MSADSLVLESDTNRVRLGTLRIDLSTGPSVPTSWSPLTGPILTDLLAEVAEASEECFKAVRYLLDDTGLSFSATYIRDQTGMLIRASILPSDAKGSLWKRTQEKIQTIKNRKNYIKDMFWHLRSGWDGEGDFLMNRTEEDLARIQDLYRAIPSPPEPDFEVEPGLSRSERDFRSRLMCYEEPEGVKTTLYRYQLRTVARMLQMETQPDRLADIHFLPFRESGRDGTYYVDWRDGDIQKHPGWYSLPRGGILAEQMGTGKTLAVLTLIVGTKATPPTPPPDALDASPVMNKFIRATYPFPAYQRARGSTPGPLHGADTSVPTLPHLCVGILARTDLSAARSALMPEKERFIATQDLYYVDYPVPDDCARRVRQSSSTSHSRHIWLANTTLVVVPQILIDQWKQEIEKHLEPGTLSVLVIGKDMVPPVRKLMKHDLVLIDVLRFGHEFSRGNSEFFQARWKRIVLDEGHVAGTKTDAMRLAMSMSIERRWIVSGTPTKHLQQGGEVEVRASVKREEKSRPRSLAWSKRDLEDAQRIGVMAAGFLAAQPFQSEANFNERITNLLRGKDGPKFGSVRRLKYIMDALMVKHARNVIDLEASLPPSTVTTEMLQFHPMQRITYNVLASLIASNVYTSNFEDPDYFLHPRNVASFKQVINNLHLACFWYSAYEMGARECLDRTQKHLETNTTLNPAGRVVLEEAVRHLEAALATPGWEEWMANGVSLPYEAGALPALIRDGWSDSMDGAPSMIDGKSLYHLRNLNESRKTATDVNRAGWDERGLKHQEYLQVMEREHQKALRLERSKLLQLDELDMERDSIKDDVKAAAHTPTSMKTFGRQKKAAVLPKGKKGKKGSELDERLDEAARNAEAASKAIRFDTPERDLGPRPMPEVLVTKTRSAKLNFVIKSILESKPDDKYVIFGDVYELGHVSEALDLIDVKSCFAGTSVSIAKRAEALKEIEKPETKVILLDLKLGARGLNLVCANRMIFLSPVWNPDVQAQAVKRVHRIGQVKPTKVEILVTQGTFEEDIAERSSSLRTDTEEQLYSRAMIENPSFVYPEDEGSYTFPIRFIPEVAAVSSPTASPPDISPTTPTSNTNNTKLTYPPIAVSPTIGFNEEEMGDVIEYRPGPAARVPKKRETDDIKPVLKSDGPRKKRARVAFA